MNYEAALATAAGRQLPPETARAAGVVLEAAVAEVTAKEIVAAAETSLEGEVMFVVLFCVDLGLLFVMDVAASNSLAMSQSSESGSQFSMQPS